VTGKYFTQLFVTVKKYEILQIFIFVLLALPLFGLTKADFVECLNLVFDQHEFQPAFTNHPATKGNVVIVAPLTRISRLRTTSTLDDFRNTLTNDDFISSNHYVKILRPDELSYLEIPRAAALEIFAAGNELELKILLESLVWHENQKYSWSYTFKKLEGEWEIIGRNLTTRNVNFSSR